MRIPSPSRREVFVLKAAVLTSGGPDLFRAWAADTKEV